MAAEVEQLRGRRGRRGSITSCVAESMVVDSTLDNISAQDSSVKSIEGLGEGKHVPPYLRTEKTIKIREMALSDLKQIIKEVWDKKRAWGSLTMKDFFSKFLKNKYGLKSMILKWGYSIVHALGLYSDKDADVDTFHRVLSGEIPTAVHVEQGKMLDALGEFLSASICSLAEG